MNYIINKSILYNEEDNTLSLLDGSGNCILLPKPCARLLSLFIANNNRLLQREVLLNETLADYGLSSTNNNLNNYISVLRKALAQLGGEEMIITYPRQGLKFSATSISKAITTETDSKRIADNVKLNAKIRLVRFNFSQAIIITSSLFLFLIVALYSHNTRTSIYSLGNSSNCKIYSMRPRNGNLDKIRASLIKKKLSCQEKADVYYYEVIRNEGNDQHAQWITYCTRKQDKSPCVSYNIDSE
ncbi:TPA: transcriptional regulator [Serratia marcescens]|nr:helix-turn-helix domain-containing protein [Serratia marcescens]